MLKSLLLVCFLAAPALAEDSSAPLEQPAGAPRSLTQSAPLRAPAEPAYKQNAVYLELGGTSLLYSLNYERYLNPDLALRVGFSYISVSAVEKDRMSTESGTASWMTVPVMAEYTGIHRGSHALELGAGVNLMYFSARASTFSSTSSVSGDTVIPAANIGYRYSDPKGGFVFRAGYTPLFVVAGDTRTVVSWFGTSFGVRL